jgi:hypothetical protein
MDLHILAQVNVKGLDERYPKLNNYISDHNLDGNEYISGSHDLTSIKNYFSLASWVQEVS